MYSEGIERYRKLPSTIDQNYSFYPFVDMGDSTYILGYLKLYEINLNTLNLDK